MEWSCGSRKWYRRYRAKEEGEKVKRSSVWEYFQEKDDTKAECTHCHHEFKTKYANITDLLRHLKHMHPNKYMY